MLKKYRHSKIKSISMTIASDTTQLAQAKAKELAVGVPTVVSADSSAQPPTDAEEASSTASEATSQAQG